MSKSAMKYLPFEVPAGVNRIDVAADFDWGPGKDRGIADMGAFDPRGYGPGGPGFRGWQGGAGKGFTITGDPSSTSPWYIAGQIQPGTWHLAQYYLRSTPYGLKYKYTITMSYGSSSPGLAKFPGADARTVSTEARYYSGNLHCHSTHSDGGLSFEDLIRRNRDFGFDYVASTEHNTPTAIYDFPKAESVGPLLLIGTELTTPGGHAGIIDQRPGYWWDFRTDPGDGGLRRIVAEVKRQHALLIINHPFATCTSCTWKFPKEEWAGANGIEVWNSSWSEFNEQSLAWWDELLRRGEHLNAYGGTDYHRGEDALKPATWTFSRGLNRRSVMDGLRAGHTILSDSAKQMYFNVTLDARLPGETVRASGPAKLAVHYLPGAEGVLTAFDRNGKIVFDLRPDSRGEVSRQIDLHGRGFLRFELRDRSTHAMKALSNAFFIDTSR